MSESLCPSCHVDEMGWCPEKQRQYLPWSTCCGYPEERHTHHSDPDINTAFLNLWRAALAAVKLSP